MARTKPLASLSLSLTLVVMLSGTGARAADSRVQFNRNVRPILSDTCFRCHGFDKNARKADLRLDVREESVRPRAGGRHRGATPVVPGRADDSLVWRRIVSSYPDEVMPPPGSLVALTEAQKAILRQWIEQGAAYEPHWAFIPPKRAAVPSTRVPGWTRGEIDAFVLHRLEDRGHT